MAESRTEAGSGRPRKKVRRRKAARGARRRHSDRSRLWALLALAVIVVLGTVGTIAFDDRHWQAFDDAGDVAFERRNFAYAERMYDEALQVARELEDAQLERNSLRALSRVYAAQGRLSDAQAAAQAAAQVAAQGARAR